MVCIIYIYMYIAIVIFIQKKNGIFPIYLAAS